MTNCETTPQTACRPFVTEFVAFRTFCHDNFGNGRCKLLIRGGSAGENPGLGFALKGLSWYIANA